MSEENVSTNQLTSTIQQVIQTKENEKQEGVQSQVSEVKNKEQQIKSEIILSVSERSSGEVVVHDQSVERTSRGESFQMVEHQQSQQESHKIENVKQQKIEKKEEKVIEKQSQNDGFKEPLSPTRTAKNYLIFPHLRLQLLPGEQKLISQDCLLIRGSDLFQIKIVFTNYRISFVGDRTIQLDFPIGFINKLYRTIQNKPVLVSFIEFVMKNGQQYKIKFVSSIDTSDKIFNIIGKVCYSAIIDAFAFTYYKAINTAKNKSNPEKIAESNGWKCNMLEQYKRFGLLVDKKTDNYPWKMISNLQGKVCLSYPGLLIIPDKIDDETLQKCLKHRYKQRIPILAYAYCLNFSTQRYSCLWRSAQPKSNKQTTNRNLADQQYITLLGVQESDEPKSKPKKDLVIYDIKSKQTMNIMSNNKSVNQLANYKNVIPRIVELPSIVSIRECYIKAVSSCQNTDPTKWFASYEQSKWLQNTYLLVKQAFNIAQDLTNEVNVLVQCQDGCDRTSQLTALAQIIIDPYYRTKQGFGILIEKQFVSAGHQFGLRLGWNKDKDKEDQKSPIFIQFLDAVYQLVYNYPLSFQYTGNYLAQISCELYSNRFGNFLCNSFQQQMQNSILFSTLSIWKHLESNQSQMFSNPYYQSAQQTDIYQLKQPLTFKHMTFWRQHFSQYYNHSKAHQNSEQNQISQNNQDYLMFFHNQIKKQTEQFKELLTTQYSSISTLKAELEELESN